jgi:hypothetical protein
VLLNRYDQHTRHCASFSRALATVQRWKPRVVGAGLLIGTVAKGSLDFVMAPNKSLALVTVVAVLLALVWKHMCGLEEALLRGPYPAPRNVEEGFRIKCIYSRNKAHNMNETVFSGGRSL